MPFQYPLPREVARLLREQQGVVTVAQLLEAGLTQRVCERVTSGWIRLARGLYLAGSPSFEAATWAASLFCGPNSVIGSSAAAYLAGVLRDPPSEVVIWGRDQHRSIQIGRWRTRPRRGLRDGRGSPARLSIEEALLDLARDESLAGTMDAIARAFVRQYTTPARVLTALDRRERIRHSAQVRALCSAGKAGIESALEWLFDERVIVAHRLPAPQRQIRSEEGRIDCHFDAFRVIAELMASGITATGPRTCCATTPMPSASTRSLCATAGMRCCSSRASSPARSPRRCWVAAGPAAPPAVGSARGLNRLLLHRSRWNDKLLSVGAT